MKTIFTITAFALYLNLTWLGCASLPAWLGIAAVGLFIGGVTQALADYKRLSRR